MADAEDLRKVLADIVLGAVMHPAHPAYEIIPRATLDEARMVIDQSDLAAAAERARERRHPSMRRKGEG